MPSNITAYDLLISCPSDVAEYVDLLEQEVLRFNSFYGRSNNIIVRTRHWSRDAYATLAAPPQESLNQQIVDSSDMVLGVFWTRFGTKTENYGSGTEEEIERMLAMKKQVFLYFLDKPIHPSKIEPEQYKKIQAFMETCKRKGIFFRVSDENALRDKFRADLELYFNYLVSCEGVKKSSGKNEILWVDDQPENNVYVRNTLSQYGFSFTLALSTKQALHCIKYNKFSLVISDLGRKEGKYEGFVLLDEIRKADKNIPFIIHTASKKQENRDELLKRGGQGYVNSREELIDLVINMLLKN